MISEVVLVKPWSHFNSSTISNKWGSSYSQQTCFFVALCITKKQSIVASLLLPNLVNICLFKLLPSFGQLLISQDYLSMVTYQIDLETSHSSAQCLEIYNCPKLTFFC
ncbi:hypothetical protein F0562_018740 [Nyssa sinensis]|uniref:Uncharacterized protein n=1 Tax=Nyssa sinensis TaxID=561372 RepID=A0A5J4ZCK6_9ASTE|nr:hypothetical protein F0562_018740 [Nyssa sinensis]